jgi:hypothetical protein
MLINTKLISHPVNWATVFLMVFIAGTFGALLLKYLQVKPADQGSNDAPTSAWGAFPAGSSPAQSIDVLRPALEFNNSAE